MKQQSSKPSFNRLFSRVSPIGVIRDLPRWIFLGTLIYAPWAYGSTWPSTIIGMKLLLGAVLVFWLLEMAIRRRDPHLPVELLIVSALILGLGWWMTLNARAIYDTELQIFAPIRQWFPLAPSSVDAPKSLATMGRITVLVGSLLFVADLSRRSDWLLRLWITLGLAGGSIALFGLVQKAADAPMIFWGEKTWEFPYRPSFFATYYYHANAGAFLNLVFPATAGLALRAFQRAGVPVQRAIWSTATLLLVAATFTNTSRVAQLLGLVAILALTAGQARSGWWRAVSANRVAAGVTIAAVVVALVLIAQASGVTKAAARWNRAIVEIPADPRWPAYKMALEALPDAGWTGFGPGTFQLIFPEYERLHAVEDPGHWEFLHQDYLQTILEWGWGGAACWAMIFFGGIGVAIRAFGRLRHHLPTARISRVLPLILIALGTVMLHSLVDFPLQIASLQLYAATYLGICWSCRGASRQLAAK